MVLVSGSLSLSQQQQEFKRIPMIHSQDGLSLPPAAPASVSNTGGFAQVGMGDMCYSNPNPNPNQDNPSVNPNKRKRNMPRSPDPGVEVVAMSPKTLMTTNRFICEICSKGFQRDQNLQLHRRGHNLPWKLKQKDRKEQAKKKVYVCPERTCVHHDASRALGDLTGIKKHFSRKHGEKRWKCDKCTKKYAVMSDWKAHAKICGTRQYKCDCGTIFSRKDSFTTHRAFCDAITEERMRANTNTNTNTLARTLNPSMGPHLISGLLMGNRQSNNIPSFSASHRPDFFGFEPSTTCTSVINNNLGMMGDNSFASKSRLPLWLDHPQVINTASDSFMASSSSNLDGSGHVFPPANLNLFASSSSHVPQGLKEEEEDNRRSNYGMMSLYSPMGNNNLSATALLQKAAQMGSAGISSNNSPLFNRHQINGLQGYSMPNDELAMSSNPGRDGMRDFLGTLGGGGEEEDTRLLLQEEMAYSFGAMAGSHDHQEPYKDLMR